eukprot:gb/GECG01013600.1/.p1 GENE.gb/GECG01013600.1/~~gb/GECG01013600.1/.p1  ORF type:complete len:101 (+),score=4.58 gb/GECG01013600.1/:1-303(+)
MYCPVTMSEQEGAYGDFTSQNEDMMTLAEIRARFDPKLRYHSMKLEEGIANVGQSILDPCTQSITATNSQLERSLREARVCNLSVRMCRQDLNSRPACRR